MTEIKFRAYRISDSFNKKWFYSDDYKTLEGFFKAVSYQRKFGCEMIVSRFTGSKDKNNKEIYNGDVIKIPDDWDAYGFMAGEKRVIYFLDGCFRLKPKNNNEGRGHTIEDDINKCEVIGNIYGNKNNNE